MLGHRVEACHPASTDPASVHPASAHRVGRGHWLSDRSPVTACHPASAGRCSGEPSASPGAGSLASQRLDQRASASRSRLPASVFLRAAAPRPAVHRWTSRAVRDWSPASSSEASPPASRYRASRYLASRNPETLASARDLSPLSPASSAAGQALSPAGRDPASVEQDPSPASGRSSSAFARDRDARWSAPESVASASDPCPDHLGWSAADRSFRDAAFPWLRVWAETPRAWSLRVSSSARRAGACLPCGQEACLPAVSPSRHPASEASAGCWSAPAWSSSSAAGMAAYPEAAEAPQSASAGWFPSRCRSASAHWGWSHPAPDHSA